MAWFSNVIKLFFRNLLRNPNMAFGELLAPNFFTDHQAQFVTIEEYAKWLKRKYAEYCSLALNMDRWITAIRA